MNYNFDEMIDRYHSDSIKWRYYPQDVLPMWVADMDFASPDAVMRDLKERIEHGVFGYALDVAGLAEAIVDWLSERFGWRVDPEALVYLPGVVVGFNLAAHALVKPGKALAYQTPVYMPFLTVARNAELEQRTSLLSRSENGRYEIDWEAFEQSLDESVEMFLFCSPHNPVGRVWQRWELERIAEICLRKGVWICSDEIHADLVYPPHRHLPIAALGSEVANRTITLMAPSKTFNIPGLGFSFAVVQDAALRKRFEHAGRGLVGHPNLLGMVAARAAYREGKEWLGQLCEYLDHNRSFLMEWISRELPEVKCSAPEGTYLAWLDFSAVPNGGKTAMKLLLESGKVALNDGEAFGPGGEGFVRLNFGCPRATLQEGLERIRLAIRKE